MNENEKLLVLSGAAKYDVSCASSGCRRENSPGGVGESSRLGICHSWSDDGRCISLLKILFTNKCVYDCAYCANRRSNDVARAAFTVDEMVDMTMGFYRRNYIEGLFLSSGVETTPDKTMEQMVEVARRLRELHQFNGYIHLKGLPGASPEIMRRAGLYADRLSVNIELPSEESLVRLAPQKGRHNILVPMGQIADAIRDNRDERKHIRSTPRFAPAGQSTQLIVSASPEPDAQILRLSESLYNRYKLKRVYYSAYVPVNDDNRLPYMPGPDMVREHRLYQADWLLRFYGFGCSELLDDGAQQLDREVDPKCAWALRHMEWFPVEVTRADYEALLRVPGIGVRSAKRIIATRRMAPLRFEDLGRLGVVMRRARYFVTCHGRYLESIRLGSAAVRTMIVRPAAGTPALTGIAAQPELFGEL